MVSTGPPPEPAGRRRAVPRVTLKPAYQYERFTTSSRCPAVVPAEEAAAAGAPPPSRFAAPQPDTASAPASTAAAPPLRITFMSITVAAGGRPATWPRGHI